jgi:hypothetical protein
LRVRGTSGDGAYEQDCRGFRQRMVPLINTNWDGPAPDQTTTKRRLTGGEAWMLQMASSLVDTDTGTLRARPYLLLERDRKYAVNFPTRGQGQRDERDTTHANVTEVKRLCRTVRSLDQRPMSG